MDEQRKGIDTWAVVEIMGHKRIAGHVTEEPIAGTNMLRIDVPAVDGRPAYTVYHGGSAIYGITPCTEELARRAASDLAYMVGSPLPVYVPELDEAHRTIDEAKRATEQLRQLASGPDPRDNDRSSWADAEWDDDKPF
jgi:hypothetical protein